VQQAAEPEDSQKNFIVFSLVRTFYRFDYSLSSEFPFKEPIPAEDQTISKPSWITTEQVVFTTTDIA
jgi:hypothetical protein